MLTVVTLITVFTASTLIATIFALRIASASCKELTKLCIKYTQEIEINTYNNIIEVCEANPDVSAEQVAELLRKFLIKKEVKL